MAMSLTETHPVADWMLITGKNKDQNAKACLVARDFDSGIMLAITQKSSGNISLGFNFRKDIFTLGKTHYVALSTDTGYNKLYQIKTTSPREIILDLPNSIQKENPLYEAREIYVNIEGLHSYKFSLSDMGQGLNKLSSCLGPSTSPKTDSQSSEQAIQKTSPTIPSQIKGLNPDSFTDVLNNLTLQKSTPIVKIPVPLPKQKIEATPVLETKKGKEPPVADEQRKEDFAYTPPSFFSSKEPALQKTADVTEKNDPVSESAIEDKANHPVPGSIAAMEQKMQDAKEGKFPPPQPPTPQVVAKETVEQEDKKVNSTGIAENKEEVSEAIATDPLEEQASMEDAKMETDTVPVDTMQQAVSSNEYLDPELVESLVQKIKLLEIEKESLRDRLHEYEIDDKIINQIKPNESTE